MTFFFRTLSVTTADPLVTFVCVLWHLSSVVQSALPRGSAEL